MSSTVFVAPIENVFPDVVGMVASRIVRELDARVEVVDLGVPLIRAFDPDRGQYNSSLVLAALLERLPSPDARLLGITGVDLFIPVLTFVFGEAQLSGSVAVASTWRLRNAFYGLPDDPDLLSERLARESLHELGHTFGLVHCPDYGCVMQASTSVEEIDVKGAGFCPSCRSMIAAGARGA